MRINKEMTEFLTGNTFFLTVQLCFYLSFNKQNKLDLLQFLLYCYLLCVANFCSVCVGFSVCVFYVKFILSDN